MKWGAKEKKKKSDIGNKNLVGYWGGIFLIEDRETRKGKVGSILSVINQKPGWWESIANWHTPLGW